MQRQLELERHVERLETVTVERERSMARTTGAIESRDAEVDRLMQQITGRPLPLLSARTPGGH